MNAAVAIGIVVVFGRFIEILNVVNIAILLTYMVLAAATFVFPLKRPGLWEGAPVKFRGLWLISVAGSLATGLLLGSLMANSQPQFILTAVWMSVGSLVYHLSLEKHRLHERIFREMRAQRERAKAEKADGV